MGDLTIKQLLHKVQMSLVAPKSQFNAFGKYHYRSCEDILEGLKKVMPEGCSVVLSDEIKLIGDRYYVEATAFFFYGDSVISAKASAREPLEKKGMDSAQVTGSTSSYARKYALNALFCIEDSKDADYLNNDSNDKKPSSRPIEFPKKPEPKKENFDVKAYAEMISNFFKDNQPDLAIELCRDLSSERKKQISAQLDEMTLKWLKQINNKDKDKK